LQKIDPNAATTVVNLGFTVSYQVYLDKAITTGLRLLTLYSTY